MPQMDVPDISKRILQRRIRVIGSYRNTIQLQFRECDGRNIPHTLHLQRIDNSDSLVGSHNNPAILQSQHTAFAIYIAQHVAGKEIILKSL